MSIRSRRGLATWLTSSRSPLFVLDSRSIVLVFNRGCEELTQWAAADIIGKSCQVQSTADPTHWSCLTGVLAPEEVAAGEPARKRRVVFHRKDGSIIERDIHFFPLEPEDPADGQHLLGLITEPTNDAPSPTSRRLDVARHTAEIYERYRLDRLVTTSVEMQRVASQIQLARTSAVTVHFSGDRGVGKEHIARLVHYGSEQRNQRFVPIRCAESSRFEISRTLNRLYDPDGVVEPVTIYLDQFQMLDRDLQERVLYHADLSPHRHFSSSNLWPGDLARTGMIPELAVRLSAIWIAIPALKDRGEDILLIAQQLLEEQNRLQEEQRHGLTPAVERLFQLYNWPGNVDELARVVSQAMKRTQGPMIDVGDLPPDFGAGLSAQALRPPPHRRSLEDELSTFERERIEQALAEVRGNKSAAAELLQLPRAKLYRRMAALGLATDEDVSTGNDSKSGDEGE
ncbi:helix-turn-helix domain-containing protein [Planctomicrobium sp. SH527]|uniref:helix-turn-helix domain-containing protein n=1 Tax=Planctomicrobium sp. SH527 TaxID=3448123 RepID=UPI003F5CBA3F